jgi:hypothetical protein
LFGRILLLNWFLWFLLFLGLSPGGHLPSGGSRPLGALQPVRHGRRRWLDRIPGVFAVVRAVPPPVAAGGSAGAAGISKPAIGCGIAAPASPPNGALNRSAISWAASAGPGCSATAAGAGGSRVAAVDGATVYDWCVDLEFVPIEVSSRA